MEQWRLHSMIETDEQSGEERQIGGSIVKCNISALNGNLSTIDVSPVSIEEMKDDYWESDYVRIQVADRVVWMDLEEVHALIGLLDTAARASLKRYQQVFPEES